MERALNEIVEIISNMSWGIVNDNDDAMALLKGYLIALNENGEITASERLMLMRFFMNLVKDKEFIAK